MKKILSLVLLLLMALFSAACGAVVTQPLPLLEVEIPIGAPALIAVTENPDNLPIPQAGVDLNIFDQVIPATSPQEVQVEGLKAKESSLEAEGIWIAFDLSEEQGQDILVTIYSDQIILPAQDPAPWHYMFSDGAFPGVYPVVEGKFSLENPICQWGHTGSGITNSPNRSEGCFLADLEGKKHVVLFVPQMFEESWMNFSLTKSR